MRLGAVVGEEIDAAVIGGGIAGAAVARDLALRGVSVALFERGDFGARATGGGLGLLGRRRLGNPLFDLARLRATTREREAVARLAPHLVRPVPLLEPIFGRSAPGLLGERITLALGNWLAPSRGGRRRLLRPVETLTLEPGLRPDDLSGAVLAGDGFVVSPERLCLENVLSACRHGAHAFNYCEVVSIAWRDTGVSLRVRDLQSDRIHAVGARVAVNAAGASVDGVRALAGLTRDSPRTTRLAKATHCVLPRLTERALVASMVDDRMLFIVPWREFSVVGAADGDFQGDPDRVEATREDVVRLLEEVRRLLPAAATADSIIAARADVYARPVDERTPAIRSEGGGARFVSVVTSDLGSFLRQAREAGDHATRVLGRSAPCGTAELALDGLDTTVSAVPESPPLDVASEARATGVSRETLEILLATYGRAYAGVLDLADTIADGRARLCPRNAEIVAQLHHAVAAEMAVSLQDVLLRRTGIGSSPCQGRDCAEPIGRRMAALLGWSRRRLAAELRAWEAQVERGQRFRPLRA